MLQRRTMLSTLAALAAAFVFISFFVTSCDDNPTDTDLTDLRITKISGDGQTERVQAMLPEPLVVRVTNVAGERRPGIAVTFSTQNPGAEVVPPTAVTNSEGQAYCGFKLGTEVGAYQIMAAVTTDSTTFSASATTRDSRL